MVSFQKEYFQKESGQGVRVTAGQVTIAALINCFYSDFSSRQANKVQNEVQHGGDGEEVQLPARGHHLVLQVEIVQILSIVSIVTFLGVHKPLSMVQRLARLRRCRTLTIGFAPAGGSPVGVIAGNSFIL